MIEHIQADMHIYKEKWENIKEWLAQGTLCWHTGPEKLGQSHCCGFASIAHVSLILCMLCHSTGGTQCWQHHQPDLHCSLIFTLQIPAGCHRSWDRGLCLHVTVAGLSDIPLKSLCKQPWCHSPCSLQAEPANPVSCVQTPRTQSFSNLRVTCQDTMNVPIGSFKYTRYLARFFF